MENFIKNPMELIDLGIYSGRQGVRLNENELSIFRLKTTGITFNTMLSKKILELGFLRANYQVNKLNKDVFIVLSKDEGIIVSKTGQNFSNLSINNKNAVKIMCGLLDLEFKVGMRYKLTISDNLSKNENYYVVKIINVDKF